MSEAFAVASAALAPRTLAPAPSSLPGRRPIFPKHSAPIAIARTSDVGSYGRAVPRVDDLRGSPIKRPGRKRKPADAATGIGALKPLLPKSDLGGFADALGMLATAATVVDGRAGDTTISTISDRSLRASARGDDEAGDSAAGRDHDGQEKYGWDFNYQSASDYSKSPTSRKGPQTWGEMVTAPDGASSSSPSHLKVHCAHTRCEFYVSFSPDSADSREDMLKRLFLHMSAKHFTKEPTERKKYYRHVCHLCDNVEVLDTHHIDRVHTGVYRKRCGHPNCDKFFKGSVEKRCHERTKHNMAARRPAPKARRAVPVAPEELRSIVDHVRMNSMLYGSTIAGNG